MVAQPLDSRPPAQAEKRSKQRHDPAKKPAAKASVPAKPKQSASMSLSAKRKRDEELLRQKDLEEALERNILAHAAAEKKKAEAEAAKRQKDLDAAKLANEQAEAKRKLAEAKANEEKAAAEAKKLAEVDAKQNAEQEARRKATLVSKSAAVAKVTFLRLVVFFLGDGDEAFETLGAEAFGAGSASGSVSGWGAGSASAIASGEALRFLDSFSIRDKLCVLTISSTAALILSWYSCRLDFVVAFTSVIC